VLSLDFLVGFTIFLLALIMVVSMVPGLLAGLESSGIDYDAVAYRTGVILVEDPGWPVSPPWESKGVEHKDKNIIVGEEGIQRMGLAVSREAPNILLSAKVEKFFNDTFFDRNDYRSKVIFGDIPYSYRISLRSLDDTYHYMTGDLLPADYGYIRRVVKIKEPSWTEIVGSNSNYWTAEPTMPTQNFIVRFDFSQLRDQTISPVYQIDPRRESVNVTITKFEEYHNDTTNDMILQHIRFQKVGVADDIPFEYEIEDPDLYILRVDGNLHHLTPNTTVSENISLVLKPAATADFPLDDDSILNIHFTFGNTKISGTHNYDYKTPPLKTGVLEVAIW